MGHNNATNPFNESVITIVINEINACVHDVVCKDSNVTYETNVTNESVKRVSYVY